MVILFTRRFMCRYSEHGGLLAALPGVGLLGLYVSAFKGCNSALEVFLF